MFGIPKTYVALGAALALGGAAVGGYFYGVGVGKDSVTADFEKYKRKAAENELRFEQKLSKLTTELANANSALTEKVRVKYVDRVNTVTKTKFENRDVIKQVFVNSPFMPKGWVYAHDQLARNESIDPTKASNPEPSSFTWKDSLVVIGSNYSIAETARQKDESWNEFYSGVRSNFGSGADGMPTRPTGAAGDSEPTASPE